MSTQNKMSIKQVIRKEYKIIGLFSIIAILLPFISEAIFVTDLIRYNHLSFIEKFAVLLGRSDFAFTDVSLLALIGMIISTVCIPIFAVIMARKINGQRLLDSISEGLKDIGTGRFWQYVAKVYLPFFLIIFAATFSIRFIPETVVLNILGSLLTSNIALVIAGLLLIIISILVTSIAGTIFVANTVYMRSECGVREAFKAIPSRETNKLIIFNAIESVVGVVILVGFISYLLLQNPINFIASVISVTIGLVLMIMIYQLIFIYLRFSLYMNIGSKVELAVREEAVEVTEAIELNEEPAVVELSVKPKGSNRIKNKHIDNPVELSIKPKGANRSNLINSEQLDSNKPKRSIR